MTREDRRQIGVNLLYLFMGLIMGIVGNLMVSFYMKMLDTNYSNMWVISFSVSVIALVIFSIWWIRYAIRLIRE